MTRRTAALDRIFHALADASRREMVERLGRGPASMTELARPFTMALPSVSKHLSVLEGSGLVRSRKIGRVRMYRIQPRVLTAAERWVSARRAAWNARFDRLDELLAEELDRSGA